MNEENLILSEENEDEELEETEENEDEELGEKKGGRKTKEESRHYVYINDVFRFSSDNYCFILERFAPAKEISRGKFKGQTSKGKWMEVGYHGEFKHLVRYCIQYYIRDSFGDLKEIYKRIEEMEHIIEETLPKIIIEKGVCKYQDDK